MPNDFEAAPQGDSLADAALAMPDDLGALLGENEQRQPQPRDPQSQQWRSPEEEARQPKPKQARDVADPAEAVAQDEQTDEVSPVDEEYFEIEVEKDGKPVKERMKAQEVWAEAQEAKRLRVEMQDIQRNVVPPEYWDHEVMKLSQLSQSLDQALVVQRMRLQPQKPNPELMNPDSPRYNTELYYRQSIKADQDAAEIQHIEQQREYLAQQQQAQVSRMQEAQLHRERDKLHREVWPELKDQKEAAKVRDELIRHFGKYGVNDAYIAKFDAAAFAIVKDALAYRRGQQAREAAVKVVRAKPKLVRAPARESQSPNNRRAAAGFGRLQQTGSIEDAAAALDGLL